MWLCKNNSGWHVSRWGFNYLWHSFKLYIILITLTVEDLNTRKKRIKLTRQTVVCSTEEDEEGEKKTMEVSVEKGKSMSLTCV